MCVCVCMLLLQALEKAHARGKVVTYRVNTMCNTSSNEREIPAGNKMTSLQLTLPVNLSCVVHLDAATERGFNNSLKPASVIIPAHYDGKSLYRHCRHFLTIFIQSLNGKNCILLVVVQ